MSGFPILSLRNFSKVRLDKSAVILWKMPETTWPEALTAKCVVAPVVSSNLAATIRFFGSSNLTSSVKEKTPPFEAFTDVPFLTVGM